jgi:hypothetical protein
LEEDEDDADEESENEAGSAVTVATPRKPLSRRIVLEVDALTPQEELLLSRAQPWETWCSNEGNCGSHNHCTEMREPGLQLRALLGCTSGSSSW